MQLRINIIGESHLQVDAEVVVQIQDFLFSAACVCSAAGEPCVKYSWIQQHQHQPEYIKIINNEVIIIDIKSDEIFPCILKISIGVANK